MCQTREANPFWRQRALAAEFQIRRLIRFAMERKRKMAADHVYLQAPYGGEIREVEAKPEILIPLLVAGWHQVPAPADQEPAAPVGIIKDSE